MRNIFDAGWEMSNGLFLPAASVGSAPFSPTSLSAGKLLCESDVGVTVVSTMVTTWTNQIDGTQPLNASVAGFSGVYSASDAAYGGKPSIALSAGHVGFEAATIAYGAYTIVMVARFTSAGGYNYVHVSDSGANGEYLFAGGLDTRRSSVAADRQISAGDLTGAAPKVWIFTCDGTGANMRILLNGGDQTMNAPTGGNPGTGSASGAFSVFNAPGGGSANTGTLGAVYVRGAYSTPTELSNLNTYFTTKFGIT